MSDVPFPAAIRPTAEDACLLSAGCSGGLGLKAADSRSLNDSVTAAAIDRGSVTCLLVRAPRTGMKRDDSCCDVKVVADECALTAHKAGAPRIDGWQETALILDVATLTVTMRACSCLTIAVASRLPGMQCSGSL